MAIQSSIQPVCRGLLTYGMRRRRDGQRIIRAKYLVEITRTGNTPHEGGPDGVGSTDLFEIETSDPDFILTATDLPRPGDTWGDARARGKNLADTGGSKPFVDTTYTDNLRCGWDRTVRTYKHKEGEKGQFFTVACIFADGEQLITDTIPNYQGQQNPETRTAGNPYFGGNGLTTVNGGISKTSRLKLGSFAGNPVRDFWGNPNESTELVRQESYLTVTINKNYDTTTPTQVLNTYRNQGLDADQLAALNSSIGVQSMLTRLSFALNRVNYAPMWGFPARHVRFEDFSYEIGYNERGEAVLMTSQTYKIAPPWLTRIPGVNPEAKFRSSYGFDEPQIILSTKFLNKNKFRKPDQSIDDDSDEINQRYQGASTSSGKAQAGEATVADYEPYVRARPGMFHIPPAGAYAEGGIIIANPVAFEYNKGSRSESEQFDSIFIQGYGWSSYANATDPNTWDDILANNNLPGIGTELGRLTIMDWVFWNPASRYDSTSKVFDYSLKPSEWQKLGQGTDRYKFHINPSERIKFADIVTPDSNGDYPVDGNGNLQWQPTTALPSVYQTNPSLWTDQITGFGTEHSKRVSEKGHPIWVNTIATDSNFDKWPGFPYKNGQDLAEMAVYSPIDPSFDFQNELDLPDVPVSL